LNFLCIDIVDEFCHVVKQQRAAWACDAFVDAQGGFLSTVFHLLAERSASGWEEASISDDAGRLRCSDLLGAVEERAASLALAGVKRGDRVLIALRNSIEWIVSTFAVMRLGAIAAPMDPEATEREVRVYESIVEPRGAIVAHATERFRCPILLPGNGTPVRSLPQPPGPDDSALILFTSGTTGFPKAAVQPHRVLVYAGEGLRSWLGLTAHDRLLLCMPLFHANGIYYSLMGGLCAGANIHVAPRFSVSGFWDLMRRVGATEVNLMGPMIAMLLSQKPSPGDRDHSLKLVYTAAVRQKVAEEFSSRFGVDIVEGYGLTETPYGCINPRNAPRWGSVGIARQHPDGALTNEVRVADEKGHVLPDGATGEIQIRNGASFTMYWNNPEATRAAYLNGWLRTGDLGFRDIDGYFHIVGRAKEIIRRKGVNIAPAEIELVMSEIPDIQDAALVGLPSPLGEDLAVAVVTLKDGVSREGAEDRILHRMRSLVSREKLPDRIVVAAALPKTRTHRVEKSKLREWLQSESPTNNVAGRR
jgi:carnitine-CoA ligase